MDLSSFADRTGAVPVVVGLGCVAVVAGIVRVVAWAGRHAPVVDPLHALAVVMCLGGAAAAAAGWANAAPVPPFHPTKDSLDEYHRQVELTGKAETPPGAAVALLGGLVLLVAGVTVAVYHAQGYDTPDTAARLMLRIGALEQKLAALETRTAPPPGKKPSPI